MKKLIILFLLLPIYGYADFSNPQYLETGNLIDECTTNQYNINYYPNLAACASYFNGFIAALSWNDIDKFKLSSTNSILDYIHLYLGYMKDLEKNKTNFQREQLLETPADLTVQAFFVSNYGTPQEKQEFALILHPVQKN